MCASHYRQWKKGEELRPLEARTKHHGGRWVGPHGYVYRYVRVLDGDGKMRPRRFAEHRLVMERHIGRKLHGDENVHHINGDRADNRIENLELWSSSQPPGQRWQDKLAWAREIVARYGGWDTEAEPMERQA